MNVHATDTSQPDDPSWRQRVFHWFTRLLRARDDTFPPEDSWFTKFSLWIMRLLFLGGLLLAADQLSFEAPSFLSSCTCWAYAGFGIALIGLLYDRYLRHEMSAHNSRLEDPSAVHGWIVEARGIQHDSGDLEKSDDDLQKKKALGAEADRLEELGLNGWTEYEILPLTQMLVRFLNVDELKARALSNLDLLADYAEDRLFRYDYDLYNRWKDRIAIATEKIDGVGNKGSDKAEKTSALRAELEELLEHVADYNANWAQGSAVVRDLMICGAVAVPILLIMALVPLLHPSGDRLLNVINWGVLGISGSLTAVLLYLYKSNRVEVGNTEGKNELWRAVLSVPLGLVAGIVVHSIVSGGLVTDGAAVPKQAVYDAKNIGLSVLWALGAGFFFESVFDRLRRSLDGTM